MGRASGERGSAPAALSLVKGKWAPRVAKNSCVRGEGWIAAALPEPLRGQLRETASVETLPSLHLSMQFGGRQVVFWGGVIGANVHTVS